MPGSPRRLWGTPVNPHTNLTQAKRLGTGLAFIVAPLVFVFAFAEHPGLVTPHLMGPEDLVMRALHNPELQFGHALVTLDTALLVVAAIHYMRLLEGGRAEWSGFIGGCLAVFGALMLAADKGALCLTLSGLDTLSPDQLAGMMPGLLAIFSKQGWLVLLWGIVFLPLGFAIQAVGLLRARLVPRWQALLVLVAMLLIATPDGVEIVNLTGAVLLSAAFLPYGSQLIAGRRSAA